MKMFAGSTYPEKIIKIWQNVVEQKVKKWKSDEKNLKKFDPPNFRGEGGKQPATVVP